MTRKSWSRDDLKNLRVMWLSGMAAIDMAEFFGVRASTIHNKARAIGLPKRQRYSQRKADMKPEPPVFDLDNPDHRRARLEKTPRRIEQGITIYECPTHYAAGYDRDLKWK